MKIAIDARPLSVPLSGVGRYISELLKNIPKNYEFHLFTHLGIHPSHKSVLEKSNSILRKSFGIAAWKGGLYFNYFLPKILKKEKFDLFWGSQQVVPPFIDNLPFVLTFYDLVLYKYPQTMRKLARWQQKIFLDMSVKKASHIISISNSTRKDLLETYLFPEEKTSVAFPAVNQKEIEFSLSTRVSNRIKNLEKGFLLSVSTIEPRKNYPFLLEVYRTYRKKIKNPKKWVITGTKGWQCSSFLSELNREIKTYKDIIFIDSPTESELHQLYHRSSLFLFASFYEGFGIPLLEALTHQKPCLVSDLPTFKEIGKDKIIYLKTQSPSVWADKIIDIENKKLDCKMDLKDFSWSQSANHMQKIFDKVVHSV